MVNLTNHVKTKMQISLLDTQNTFDLCFCQGSIVYYREPLILTYVRNIPCIRIWQREIFMHEYSSFRLEWDHFRVLRQDHFFHSEPSEFTHSASAILRAQAPGFDDPDHVIFFLMWEVGLSNLDIRIEPSTLRMLLNHCSRPILHMRRGRGLANSRTGRRGARACGCVQSS